MQLLPNTVLAGDVEDPSDGRSNRWMFHKQSAVVFLGPDIDAAYGIGTVQVLTAVRYLVDVRSKRRVSETDNLWISMGVTPISTTSPPNVSAVWTLRTLFRETRG